MFIGTSKAADLNWLVKEVNCTVPSTSTRVPCTHTMKPDRLNFQFSRETALTQLDYLNKSSYP